MDEIKTQAFKVGNEFAAFHPQASHVDPDYRDGWNACFAAAESLRTTSQPVNQCDGCMSGAPLDGNMHRAPDGKPLMVCQAHRYTSRPVGVPEGWDHATVDRVLSTIRWIVGVPGGDGQPTDQLNRIIQTMSDWATGGPASRRCEAMRQEAGARADELRSLTASPTPPAAQADELDPLRVEITSAWNDLPDNLRCHPGLKRLHRALMKVPSAAPPAAGDEACQIAGAARIAQQLRGIADRLPNVADCDGPQGDLYEIAERLEAGKVGG